MGRRLEDLWVRGVDFCPRRVEEAVKADRMLLLDMDLTAACNLDCVYCDRTVDRFRAGEELVFNERRDLIAQAAALGCETVEIPGAGEPMMDPHFWDLLECIRDHGMNSVIFTSGWFITPESARRLYDLGASVILKYNSTDRDVQDRLTRRKGFGERVERALRILLELGFNSSTPTRLALDTIVTPETADLQEIAKLFRWCRSNNVHMYGQTLIPEGRGADERLVLSRARHVELIRAIAEIDRNEFGNIYQHQPTMFGGYCCRQVNVGLFVTVYGDVYDCNGLGRLLGSVRRQGLAEIWRSERARAVRRVPQNGYCLLRERFWMQQESRADGTDAGPAPSEGGYPA